jgi:hypothetical protein
MTEGTEPTDFTETPSAVQPIDDRGYYDKFDVTRTDGASEPGGKHHGDSYLVLDLDHDPVARRLARTAASQYAQLRPRFAAELLAHVDDLDAAGTLDAAGGGPSASWDEAAERLAQHQNPEGV